MKNIFESFESLIICIQITDTVDESYNLLPKNQRKIMRIVIYYSEYCFNKC